MNPSLPCKFRTLLFRLVGPSIGDRLVWNPIIKLDGRMWAKADKRRCRIIPTVNGRSMHEAGVSANELFSLFGWGFLSGWSARAMDSGKVACDWPSKRIRRWGRIRIVQPQ